MQRFIFIIKPKTSSLSPDNLSSINLPISTPTSASKDSATLTRVENTCTTNPLNFQASCLRSCLLAILRSQMRCMVLRDSLISRPSMAHKDADLRASIILRASSATEKRLARRKRSLTSSSCHLVSHALSRLRQDHSRSRLLHH